MHFMTPHPSTKFNLTQSILIQEDSGWRQQYADATVTFFSHIKMPHATTIIKTFHPHHLVNINDYKQLCFQTANKWDHSSQMDSPPKQPTHNKTLALTGLLEVEVALLDLHDALIVLHMGGHLLGQLQSQGLQAGGLRAVHR